MKKKICALNTTVKTHPILRKHFGYCFYKAAMRFRGMMDDALAKQNLLTPQMGILRLVHESQAINQHELGEILGIDKASMVKFLDHLEKIKLITKSSHQTDRRVKLVSLTAKGVKILDELIVLRQSVEDQFLSALDADEKSVLRKIIPKLLNS